MILEELTSYAAERYQIKELHKWIEFPGVSVLCHPNTGKWLALLKREWSEEFGEELECCDIKCGQEVLTELSAPYLSKPFRMIGPKWVGVRIDRQTDKDVVLRLFDRAVRAEEQRFGFTVVVDSQFSAVKSAYQETPIAFGRDFHFDEVPERIRKMHQMFEYGDDSIHQKELNFYRQGKFMEDYEDNAPWDGEIRRDVRFYHDMNFRQLRGYFTWRTQLRNGEWHRISIFMAYIYIYELLNGIGTASPMDGVKKMFAFEKNYIDAGYGDAAMKAKLRKWRLEYAVINALPVDIVEQCLDCKTIEIDKALAVLYSPGGYADDKIVDALYFLAKEKMPKGFNEQRIHLTAEAWKYALMRYNNKEGALFDECFGVQKQNVFWPFFEAVFYRKGPFDEFDYQLNENHSFHFKDGRWFEMRYDHGQFVFYLLKTFLRETDVQLRRYLKAGRALRDSSAKDAWAKPFVLAVIEEDRKRQLEAARPKIEIHLESLDGIRNDASRTRDSLLTEDDLQDDAEAVSAPKHTTEEPLETQILVMLLNGESPDALIKANRLMPSILADTINESYFDIIGDNVLLCENDQLAIVEDYIEDVRRILEKT